MLAVLQHFCPYIREKSAQEGGGGVRESNVRGFDGSECQTCVQDMMILLSCWCPCLALQKCCWIKLQPVTANLQSLLFGSCSQRVFLLDKKRFPFSLKERVFVWSGGCDSATTVALREILREDFSQGLLFPEESLKFVVVPVD